MSLIFPKTCAMGGSNTGLVGTIGVTLLNPDGTVHTARATAGIYEIGGGCYGKEITFPDNWKGSIKWDTGGGGPVYATEDYDVEGLIDMIEADTNEMQGKLPTNNIVGSLVKTDKDDEINRILGLVHENTYIDQPGYDDNKNLTSARLRVYSVAGSVGTDNDVLATYTITAVGDGAGKFSSWKQIKQ